MAEKENAKPKIKPRYIQNKRGNDQLIDEENYLYHVDQRRGNRIWWVCTEKKALGCHGTAVVVKFEKDGVETEYATFYGEHCHMTNLAKVKAQIMDRRTVEEAKVNLSAPPSRILADSTNQFKDDFTTATVLLNRRKSSSIIRTIQKERATQLCHSVLRKSP